MPLIRFPWAIHPEYIIFTPHVSTQTNVPDIPGSIFMWVQHDCLKRLCFQALEEQQGNARSVAAKDRKVEAVPYLLQPQRQRLTTANRNMRPHCGGVLC